MGDLTVTFNEYIDKYNILTSPTNWLGDFFEKHPTSYKISLVINHLFRAALMVGLMFIPHVPLAASMSICFVGSLFYRLTVEKNCAYKFALPAFAGAAAFMLALPAFISMINGAGFTSVAIGFKTLASFVPLTLYLAYVLLTVNYDVNKTLKPPSTLSTESCPPQNPSSPETACHCHTPLQQPIESL